jgi:hypothetical protein
MLTTASLQHDHAILRAKLDALESALNLGQETWFVLRELCHSLAGQFGDHLRREDAELIGAPRAGRPEAVNRLLCEHQDQPRQFRAVNRLFVSEPRPAFGMVEANLRELIRRLRRQLDDEEATVFPLIDRRVQETMTVNRVLREHPEIRPVFDELSVSVPYEGCDCLDEVAWRRGLDSHALAEELERAIAAPAAEPALQGASK